MAQDAGGEAGLGEQGFGDGPQDGFAHAWDGGHVGSGGRGGGGGGGGGEGEGGDGAGAEGGVWGWVCRGKELVRGGRVDAGGCCGGGGC